MPRHEPGAACAAPLTARTHSAADGLVGPASLRADVGKVFERDRGTFYDEVVLGLADERVREQLPGKDRLGRQAQNDVDLLPVQIVAPAADLLVLQHHVD